MLGVEPDPTIASEKYPLVILTGAEGGGTDAKNREIYIGRARTRWESADGPRKRGVSVVYGLYGSGFSQFVWDLGLTCEYDVLLKRSTSRRCKRGESP